MNRDPTRPDPADRAPEGADDPTGTAPPDEGPLESLGRAIGQTVTGVTPPEHERAEELPADALRPGPNAGR